MVLFRAFNLQNGVYEEKMHKSKWQCSEPPQIFFEFRREERGGGRCPAGKYTRYM